jgi:heme iron utilization protein
MKDKYEEPKYLDVNHCEDKCTVDQVKREIRSLCAEEPFAVLATLGEGEPATSLISFVVSNDLKYLAFSTPTKTRKFDQIVANKKVSILIDNRSQQPESINMICGLTISDNARVSKDIYVIIKAQLFY